MNWADGDTADKIITVPVLNVQMYEGGTRSFTVNAGSDAAVPMGKAHPTRRDAPGPVGNVFQTNYTLPGADELVNLIAVAIDQLERHEDRAGSRAAL